MSQPGSREVEHEITVDAPAPTLYRLIAEVENWPRVFPPTIFVDHVEKQERAERIRLWATARGEVKNWTSRRELDPDALRITFRQEVSAHPVASMGGAWLFEPLGGNRTRVRLRHDYRAAGDDPEHLAWIDEAVDRNSRSELAALKDAAEDTANGELTFSFVDTVQIDGPAKDAYDFVNDAHLWPERLPHVARAHLTEDTPGLQTLEMDTRARDGSTHTTKSYRVTFPYSRIVYKQVTLPALMSVHTGVWTFTENDRGVAVSSQHTVVLNPDSIIPVLGPGAGIGAAREYVRSALSTNSLATLGYAKAYAEKAR